MGFDDYLRELKERIEGDAYVRLLKSNLASGHQILKVSFVPAEHGQPERYRFLLTRLGTLTDVDVPAGTEAIERLLAERKLKLDTEEDEVKRSALRFNRMLKAWLAVVPPIEMETVLRSFAHTLDASSSAVGTGEQHLAPFSADIGRAALVADLRKAFDAQVSSLVLDSGYSLELAGEIVARGLAEFSASPARVTAAPA